MSCVCLAGHASQLSFMEKMLALVIIYKLSTKFFVGAMLVGTIDFYHFLLLSLSLTLPGGLKVNAKQNLLLLI